MRFLLAVIFLGMQLQSVAQTKTDSIQLIRSALKLYDLDFTQPEADSMLDNVRDFTENYRALHKTLPTNSIPYPFAFDPLPHGETVPTKQEKIVWDISSNIQMPANKNELAFYSQASVCYLKCPKQFFPVTYR